MGGKIAFIFVAIIVLGIGLYIYNSGVVGKGFSFLQQIAPIRATSTRPAPSYQVPSYQPPASGGAVVPSPAPSASSINPAEIPAGFTANQLSPYFHQVRFGGVSAGIYGQISLYAYPKNGTSSIDVTGWQIKSNRGGAYIPQAVALYDPTGLTPASDIRLTAGDTLYLYASSAPVNLRLNKCMGYLPNRTQFNPQLPQNCPSIDRSEIQSFSGACQNYIMSLGGCQSPNFSSPYVPQNDYACREYLNNHFTYHSCFGEHQSDPDFLSREVRVWIGSSPVDPFHDRVTLLDGMGLLVDLYTY